MFIYPLSVAGINTKPSLGEIVTKVINNAIIGAIIVIHLPILYFSTPERNIRYFSPNHIRIF